MYYDIRNVGYEYLLAEQCLQAKEYEQAIAHYKAAIRNYEYADNEYILNPDHEYSIVEGDIETHYPSPIFMRSDAEEKIDKIKSIRWKLQEKSSHFLK